jgi:Ca2+-binding RTX toxin-like protein
MRSLKAVIVGAATLGLTLIPLPSPAVTPPCTITGTEGNDVFTEAAQTAGTDIVCGLGGDDTFLWSAGDDTYVGGDGRDRVSYAATPVPCPGCYGMSIDLNNHIASDGSERDDIPEVEDVEGSPWRDSIFDDIRNPNTMLGRGGADVIIFGGVGDRVLGNGGSDVVMWRYGGDVTTPELLSGNRGRDLIRAYSSQQGATVDLAAGTLEGPEVHAALVSFEDAQGSRQADTLIGDDRKNLLRGGVGDDTLFGGGGRDTLIGGTQVDTADGQRGFDRCVAETVSNCES